MKQPKKRIVLKILIPIVEIVLSLVSFILITLFDPLNLSEVQSLSSIPAFFISVIILLIGNAVNNAVETSSSNENYEKIHHEVEEHHKNIYDTVKNHMDVISIGLPQMAFVYIIENLKDLSEVKNTSFTLEDEVPVADIQLYNTKVYGQVFNKIADFINKEGSWRDIGDEYARARFKKIENIINSKYPKKLRNYNYKLILQNFSQINFILLNYKDGKKEVLFNWDFKAAGQEPIVLLSREEQIVNMFSSHFEYLWRAASVDHDSIATKSSSET